MSKMTRIMLVFVALVGIVAIGMGGTAWAAKVGPAGPVPSAGNAVAQVFAPPRQAGTVPIGPPVIPVTGGYCGPQFSALGSCANVQVVNLTNPPTGVTYNAYVVGAEVLPKELPGQLLSCAVKVEAVPGTNQPQIGAYLEVCFPLPPVVTNAFAHEWQSPWQKTWLSSPINGQSCVIIPANAVNPSYAGLFKLP